MFWSFGRCSKEAAAVGSCFSSLTSLFFDLLFFELPSAVGLRPVFLEDLPELPGRGAFLDDDADLAALVELERAQAHAAEKHLLTVAQHRAQVQPHAGHLLADQPLALLADFPMMRTSTPAFTRSCSSLSIWRSLIFMS